MQYVFFVAISSQATYKEQQSTYICGIKIVNCNPPCAVYFKLKTFSPAL